jgi:hypothetical protein
MFKILYFLGGSSLDRVGMPVSQFRILCCFLYSGSASPPAALLLSFLFITREWRMLKRGPSRQSRPGQGKGKIV